MPCHSTIASKNLGEELLVEQGVRCAARAPPHLDARAATARLVARIETLGAAGARGRTMRSRRDATTRLALLLCLASALVARAAHVVEDDATFAPTAVKEGPLAPCVQRLDYHRAVMTKTLLSVSLGAFFLGICTCTICGGLCWCASARISMSEAGGLEHTFDATSARSRFREWKQMLSGERRSAPDDDNFGISMRRQRYERVRKGDAAGDDVPPLEDAHVV